MKFSAGCQPIRQKCILVLGIEAVTTNWQYSTVDSDSKFVDESIYTNDLFSNAQHIVLYLAFARNMDKVLCFLNV